MSDKDASKPVPEFILETVLARWNAVRLVPSAGFGIPQDAIKAVVWMLPADYERLIRDY